MGQYRTYLFAAFKYAKVEKQILMHNPWEAVSVVKVMRQAGIEDSRLERLPFTKEELEIIFTKMLRPWRDLALTSFCLFGTRLGDCCRLRWQDVNWDAHRIRFVEQKTGTMRELPLLNLLYRFTDACDEQPAPREPAATASPWRVRAQGCSDPRRHPYSRRGHRRYAASRSSVPCKTRW